MPENKIHTIKNNIKANLDALVVDGVLGEVQVDDYKLGVFDRNIARYPVAILTTPSIESRVDTNVENLRTYTFDIMFLINAENVAAVTEVEDLIENILNKFDNDVTLKGATAIGSADGGVEPSTSTPEAVTSGGKTYIFFSVTLRARALRTITIT